VLTIVLKFLLLVRADRAYFGEKDLQQVLLIRDMADAFFLPVQIVSCRTVRDRNGLALSSRNMLLSEGGRTRASDFSRVLRDFHDTGAARSALESAGFEVDYIENYQHWRLGAVRLEGVRLIDNVRCKNSV
jgi:pantoate--beta-alanine ligase